MGSSVYKLNDLSECKKKKKPKQPVYKQGRSLERGEAERRS